MALSSLHLPVLTMRPGFLTFNDAHGSGLRHLFATGSIAFCGSLPHNGFRNGVPTMLDNVVRRWVAG